MGEVKAWSYSRFTLWEQCPYKFRLQNIDKLPTQTSEAMARGRRIHDDIAKYLKTPDTAPFPTGFEYQHGLIKEITTFDDKVIEEQWGFDDHWRPTGWFTKGKNATWLRNILDVGILYDDRTAETVDWKTGKPYGSYDDQMEIFAITIFQRVKDCSHVTTRLAFVDHDHQEIGGFKREELEGLIQKWNAKVAPMFADEEFLPRPNDKCKFCDFSRNNGGPCRYG